MRRTGPRRRLTVHCVDLYDVQCRAVVEDEEMWVHLRSQWRLGLSLGTLLLGAAAAHANPITLVSQTRRVQAIAVCGTEQDPQSFEATNFDPFHDTSSSKV